MQGVSWKTLYLERDERAVAEARYAAPSQELLPIYVQARRRWALRTCQPACGSTDPLTCRQTVAAKHPDGRLPIWAATANTTPFLRSPGPALQMAAAKRSEALRDAESLFRSPAASRSQQLSSKASGTGGTGHCFCQRSYSLLGTALAYSR